MTASNRRALLVPWLGLLIAVVVLVASATQSDAATLLKGSFRGHAWATFANAEAAPVATTLGRSAFQPCPCKGTDGKTLSNTVDSIATSDGGKTLRADGTLSTVFTNKTSSSTVVRNTSQVAGLNAFDGAITADAIKAVANTSANATSIQSNSNGSRFVNLRIADKAISADVAPNTRVNLPRVGYVLLKNVKEGGNGQGLGTITVEMLTVVVTKPNDFDLDIGSRIVVTHAVSGYSRTEVKAELGGQAYAATAHTTTDVIKNQVGKAAFITVPCVGTGDVRTNNVNSLDVGEILPSGTGRTTAYGKQLATGGVAKITATVQDLSLLNGLITADIVKAVAQDKLSDGNRTSSTEGTQFSGLRIAGAPVPVEVDPNTRIDLLGIGYVMINEQQVPSSTSTARVRVNGLRIVITQNSTLGLPVGTQIIIAHADATAVR
jgi:hypothetical protein